MQAQESLSDIPLTELGQPVAELPVKDVERAQRYYCDKLGFEPGWIYPGNEIGSVKRGEAAIFFRRRSGAFEPAVHWYFAVDVHATFAEMRARGANITDPLETKPWGITQFTIEDIDGNRFYFHG
jgi:catechol 2,3-dioxygenase-like lactoylglutathione lyase family enzyme